MLVRLSQQPQLAWTVCRRFYNLRSHKEDPRWPGWQVVIGIEVHAQIKSRHKLFSHSLTSDLGESPNTNVAAFDAAFPGTLPKLNRKCVDLALRTAIALQSHIQLRSTFDRKHYFYPDLPAGYQITQHYSPLARGGQLELPSENTVVRIKQVQLEQDTGKSIIDLPTHGVLIDLNRAGTGLMEIVSEPDMRSPEEAGSYVRTLQALLRVVGSSDGNMEQGSLRCDVNVSVNRPGAPPGIRCEIKNINSVKFMIAALNSEIHRHISLLTSSPPQAVPQETRGFDENTFETYKLRSKEDAEDYRYMPDPNLGGLRLTEAYIQKIRNAIPELPAATRARLKEQYNLSDRDVDVLMALDEEKEVPFDGEFVDIATGNALGATNGSRKGAVWYFETICHGIGRVDKSPRNPKVVANWITHELLGQLAACNQTFYTHLISAEQLGELIDLVQDNVITRTSGKSLLRHLLTTPSPTASPKYLAYELDLIAFSHSTLTSTIPSPSQVSAPIHSQSPSLPDLCHAAIAALPSEVAAYKWGSQNVLNKIVGHVMRASRGRADALVVRKTLTQIIEASEKADS